MGDIIMKKIEEIKHELAKEASKKHDEQKLKSDIDIPRITSDFIDETLQIA